MKQFRAIFGFEFSNYAKNKAFIIVTLLLVVGIGIGLSFPRINAMFATSEEPAPSQEKMVIAFVDKTGIDRPDLAKVFSEALDVQFEATEAGQDALKVDVESGKYESAVILTSPTEYTRIVKVVGMYDDFESRFNKMLQEMYRSEALEALGVPADEAMTILNTQITPTVLQTASGKDQMQNFFYTYILMFALYMAIVLYGQFVATSVATEKSTRAMELLITSAKPRTLMFGKVFGAGIAGISQFILIFGAAFLFYNVNKDYYKDNMIVQSMFNMPLEILLYAVLFFILGFFIYAFLFGAMASLVSRMEELSTVIMPVTMVFIIAFFVVMFSMASGNVENPLMIVCSYIPFTSPMAMFVRIAMTSVPVWEIVISVAILIVSTWLVGMFAAAVYHMGVLLYGKPPKFGELVKMLRASAKEAKA